MVLLEGLFPGGAQLIVKLHHLLLVGELLHRGSGGRLKVREGFLLRQFRSALELFFVALCFDEATDDVGRRFSGDVRALRLR